MTNQQPTEPDETPTTDAEESDGFPIPERTSRDVMYEQIGVVLVNNGVFSPAAEFIAHVRKEAGFRVSPREVVVAVEQIAGANQPVNVSSVATMVATLRGGRSARQQRHADEWRTLGAQLALRNLDGSPEGQRAFIGIAHAIAGKRATDALLLQIALTLAEQNKPLDPETVGRIGKRLAISAADIYPEQLPELVEREIRSLTRDARNPKKTKQPVRTGAYSQAHNPGARKWRPGGLRRRKIKPPPKPRNEPFER